MVIIFSKIYCATENNVHQAFTLDEISLLISSILITCSYFIKFKDKKQKTFITGDKQQCIFIPNDNIQDKCTYSWWKMSENKYKVYVYGLTDRMVQQKQMPSYFKFCVHGVVKRDDSQRIIGYEYPADGGNNFFDIDIFLNSEESGKKTIEQARDDIKKYFNDLGIKAEEIIEYSVKQINNKEYQAIFNKDIFQIDLNKFLELIGNKFKTDKLPDPITTKSVLCYKDNKIIYNPDKNFPIGKDVNTLEKWYDYIIFPSIKKEVNLTLKSNKDMDEESARKAIKQFIQDIGLENAKDDSEL